MRSDRWRPVLKLLTIDQVDRKTCRSLIKSDEVHRTLPEILPDRSRLAPSIDYDPARKVGRDHEFLSVARMVNGGAFRTDAESRDEAMRNLSRGDLRRRGGARQFRKYADR